jgi:hypothetical protein
MCKDFLLRKNKKAPTVFQLIGLIPLEKNFKKNLFLSVMNTLLIYLFASMKLEKGHKKLLGSSFKIMLPL